MSPFALTLSVAGLLLAWRAFATPATPHGSGSAGPITEAGRLAWIRDVWAAIERALPAASKSTKALILTHATYESGWGTSKPARLGNNLFNIVRGSSPGPTIESGDLDCSGGTCRPITQQFRAYGSAFESVVDYLTLLRTMRYVKAYDRLVAGDVGFVADLGRAGYYTLPIAEYQKQISTVYSSVLKRLGAAGVS